MKKKLRILILVVIGAIILGAPVIITSQVNRIVGGAVEVPIFVSLTVTFSGDGTGTVTGDVGGFTATSPVPTTATFVRGTVITLTATPTGASIFLGWSGGGCAGVGACVVTLNANTSVNAEFWGPPNPTCLWAWLRHNEGSGTTIIDYSSVGVNGTLVAWNGAAPSAAEQNYFWNTNVGFGTGGGIGVSCRTVRTTAVRNTSFVSLVAFIKPMGGGFFDAVGFVQLGESGANNFLQVGWDQGAVHFWKFNYSNGQKTSASFATYGTWYCIYGYSQSGANNNALYIRTSGAGAWTNVLLNQGAASASVSQTGIFKFGTTNNPINGVGGDALYYACDNAGGIISLAQATDIYNQLKSRYGML